MHDELRQRQEAQHDQDALHRFEDEGGALHLEHRVGYVADPTAEPSRIDCIGETLADIRRRRMAALEHELVFGEGVDAEAVLGGIRQQQLAEAEQLQRELGETALARAYRSLRTARTGKEKRSARSRVRRATRHQMARTMRENNDFLKANPQVARTIAAQIVRAEMSTHDQPNA